MFASARPYTRVYFRQLRYHDDTLKDVETIGPYRFFDCPKDGEGNTEEHSLPFSEEFATTRRLCRKSPDEHEEKQHIHDLAGAKRVDIHVRFVSSYTSWH
jgi:hypothetical protein